MGTLELYYSPTCPYCLAVIDFIESNGIEGIELKDRSISENRDFLVEANGKTQVPCLVIDGNPMLESSSIIAYLKEKFVG